MCPNLSPSQKVEIQESQEVPQNLALANHNVSEEVLLQTLLVVINHGGKRSVVRALIDTGSQCSYVLKSTVERMKIKPVGFETLNHVVFGGCMTRSKHNAYKLNVSSVHANKICEMQVLDQPTICGMIPRTNDVSCLKELEELGIQITDRGKGRLPIELLIGADIAVKLYTGQTQILKCGLVAVQTHLGWTIMGRSENHNCKDNTMTSLFLRSHSIENLWKLEAIGIRDPCESMNIELLEKVAYDHFEKTLKITEDGRYEISFPWMQSPDELPSNRELAEKQLLSTSWRLSKAGKMKDYNAVFQEWLQCGIIEECSEGPGHYLPHHAVFKPTSTTTPVRPVFDASCKSKGNMSLNDCLIKGPNLLEDIPTALLKFRQKKIRVVADIKKAFLQISVAEEDRNPFLLGAVLRHHLESFAFSPYQDVSETLKSAYYVDNCVTSVNSEKELQRFVKVSTEIMAKGKFELRAWEYSAVKRSSVPMVPSQVLGLLWNKNEDVIFCDTQSISNHPEKITRRSILSMTQQVFDPLGFSCPATLYPKLLLQESWRSELGWDTE
ncbi:uncharacterized protein, partial [Parasteatoda tepidariorum]|uniref:uncharacterized protein n=1 Tax=Parasteatoda tepidariorum TaxID=114398 RepID=UPI001C7277ED